MGVPIGVAASLLIAGYLGPAIGWRACFYLLGGIGLLLAVGLLFLGETPRKGVGTASPEKLKFREIIKILRGSLTQSPALVCTIAGGVAFHFILGAAAFDQLWFVNERGFERAEIARHSGWLAAAGGILGNLLGGWLGARVISRIDFPTGVGHAGCGISRYAGVASGAVSGHNSFDSGVVCRAAVP